MATIPKRRAVRRRKWTKKEYYLLGELGFFRGQRVELLEGEIMVLCPQKALHVYCVDLVDEVLTRVFDTGYWVRSQFPVDLGQTTEPEPDVSVVVGSRQQYLQAHPTTAVLIVEVADSSLNYVRKRKGSLYARAGIADYWVVNLVDRQIEVYRDPVPDPTQRYGYRYASKTIIVPPDGITPLALPQVTLVATDLLP